MRREGKFSQAIEPAREVAEVRARLQGADHWQAADARRAVADLRKIAALPEEGRAGVGVNGGPRTKGQGGAAAGPLLRSGDDQPRSAGDPPEVAG